MQALRFLHPTNRKKKSLPKWVDTAARAFSTVIPSSELDNLLVEARLYTIVDLPENGSGSVEGHWLQVYNDGRFPLLTALARASFTLPHGNADVERLFSQLSDIVTKKRNRLQSLSIQSLLITKAFCAAHDLTCHTFPVTQGLVESVQAARRRYADHLEEQKRK